jgi:hypothetical protein
MDQIHKRFTAEQVKVLLKGYCAKHDTKVTLSTIRITYKFDRNWHSGYHFAWWACSKTAKRSDKAATW